MSAVRREEDTNTYLFSGILFSHLFKILFKDLLIEVGVAHIYNLHWLAMLAVC